MRSTGGPNIRLIVIALLAIAILVAMVVATRGGLSTTAPTSGPAATSPPSGPIHAQVAAQAFHLSGHTWRFIYTVRNTGAAPIGGFQINAPPSNLFDISGPKDWPFFGSGVCRGNHPTLLIYWSTPINGPSLAPRESATFTFKVNTAGVTAVNYSLSWSNAIPQSGQTRGPRASSLAAGGSCSG